MLTKILLLIVSINASAAVVFENLVVTPSKAYKGETTTFIVRAKTNKPVPQDKDGLSNLSLVQTDEEGNILRYFGPMFVKKDGLLKKKARIYGKKAEMIHFAIVEDHSVKNTLENNIVHAEVSRRPTFIELLQRVWKKIST